VYCITELSSFEDAFSTACLSCWKYWWFTSAFQGQYLDASPR